MPFAYSRTVHFADTDAAGVVFFANYLAICHEAYEESLSAAGVELKTFFADNGIVIPIAKSEAEYLRPLACGEKLRITLKPAALSENSLEIRYELVGTSNTKRERAALPPAITAWLKS